MAGTTTWYTTGDGRGLSRCVASHAKFVRCKLGLGERDSCSGHGEHRVALKPLDTGQQVCDPALGTPHLDSRFRVVGLGSLAVPLELVTGPFGAFQFGA
jgi:hypothetical protein